MQKKIRKKNLIVLMSLQFFFFYGSMGFVQPYLSLQFYNIGMNGVKIGLLSIISSLLTFIISPFISIIYNNSFKRRLFTQLLVLISGLFYFLIGEVFSFWFVLIFISMSRISGSTIIPITENLAYNISISGKKEGGSRFGFIRQFGSLGYALSALIGGWMLDLYQIKINFLLNFSFMIFVMGLIQFLPESVFNFPKTSHDIQEKLRSVELLKIITSNRYLLIIITALAFFNLSSGINQFEAIFMSQLGIGEIIIGLAITITALSEIPFMLWADDLVVKFGVSKILLFVFVFEFILRFSVYIFPLRWVLFTTRIMHSVSFSLLTVLIVSLINQQVSNKYSTSALTLINVTIFGIFNMIGSGISGLIFDIYSAHELYLIGGIFCLVSVCLTIYAFFIQKKQLISKES